MIGDLRVQICRPADASATDRQMCGAPPAGTLRGRHDAPRNEGTQALFIPLYTLRPTAKQYLRQCINLYRLGVLDDGDALPFVAWVLQAQHVALHTTPQQRPRVGRVTRDMAAPRRQHAPRQVRVAGLSERRTAALSPA